MLGSRISAGVESVVHRVAFAHKRFADIRNTAGGADGKGAAVTIMAVGSADSTLGNELCKPCFRCSPALPSPALGVAAGLMQIRSVNADQADFFAADLQGVAIDHLDAAHRQRRIGLVPEPERFRANCSGDDENPEKEKGVRPTREKLARRSRRGASARTVPAQLMDGAHARRLGTTRY